MIIVYYCLFLFNNIIPTRLPQSGADYSVKVNFGAALYVISVCQFVKVNVNVKVKIVSHEP